MTTTVPYAADVPGAINTGMIFLIFQAISLVTPRGFSDFVGRLAFEKCYLTGTIFFLDAPKLLMAPRAIACSMERPVFEKSSLAGIVSLIVC